MKTILVDALNTFVIKGEGVFVEMKELLDTFPNPKIILTSANDEQFKQHGLGAMPYEVFSLKHNPEKSDPEYYRIFLDKYNLAKDGVVYFEHNPDAVKSAQSVGIISFYYDPVKKDLSALDIFLTENL